MLRRYQNESLLLLTLTLLLSAIFFKNYTHSRLESKTIISEQFASKIEDIATMKKLWQANKDIPKKLESIKSITGNAEVVKFKIDKNKADIVLNNLNGTQLNNITGKYLASIPIQIIEMTIDRNGEKYRLELQCKW